MTVRELAAAIAGRGLAPLYAVLGEEAYLRDQALALLKGAAGAEGEPDGFNLDLLYGDECDAAEILAKASEAALFGGRRLVLVRAADKLPAREGEALVPYVKAPCGGTTLVFAAPKLDGRTKFGQAVGKHALVVDCDRPPAPQLPAWVRSEAQSLGLRLDEEATQLLAELAADSLGVARRELEKLATYVPEGRAAGAADVEALRGGEPGASVFDLAGAIAAGSRARVLRILARNLEAGEAPLRILGSLVWQYRQIWKVKDLLRAGGSESQIGRTVGLSPYRLAGYLPLARRLSEAHLRRAFTLFPETDSRLKGGSGGRPEATIAALLLTLCGESGREAGGSAPPRPAAPPAGRAVRTSRSPGR